MISRAGWCLSFSLSVKYPYTSTMIMHDTSAARYLLFKIKANSKFPNVWFEDRIIILNGCTVYIFFKRVIIATNNIINTQHLMRTLFLQTKLAIYVTISFINKYLSTNIIRHWQLTSRQMHIKFVLSGH